MVVFQPVSEDYAILPSIAPQPSLPAPAHSATRQASRAQTGVRAQGKRGVVHRGAGRLMVLATLACLTALPASAQGSPPQPGLFKPDAIPLQQYQASRNDARPSGTAPTSDEYFLAIYSGSTSGFYFRAASTICALMRRTHEQHRIRCVPLRSQGAGSNLRLLQEGRVQVALVQSNNNWDLARTPGQATQARSVMSFHDETGLLVVRPDSGIRSLADLRGKRINVGPDSSASKALWTALLEASNIDTAALGRIYSVAQDYNVIGLCQNYIDAFGLWIGHPAGPVNEALKGCNARLVGMTGEGVDRLIADSPYYFRQRLPAGTYAGQQADIESYGFKASLIADARASPYVVYWLTRIIHENVDRLREMHPGLHSLDAQEMVQKGNFLPFHDGAACYWQGSAQACAWREAYPELATEPVPHPDTLSR